MHANLFNPVEQAESIIAMNPLRIGAFARILDVSLTQTDKVKGTAMATTTNFDKCLEPSCQTDCVLQPPR